MFHFVCILCVDVWNGFDCRLDRDPSGQTSASMFHCSVYENVREKDVLLPVLERRSFARLLKRKKQTGREKTKQKNKKGILSVVHGNFSVVQYDLYVVKKKKGCGNLLFHVTTHQNPKALRQPDICNDWDKENDLKLLISYLCLHLDLVHFGIFLSPWVNWRFSANSFSLTLVLKPEIKCYYFYLASFCFFVSMWPTIITAGWIHL